MSCIQQFFILSQLFFKILLKDVLEKENTLKYPFPLMADHCYVKMYFAVKT